MVVYLFCFFYSIDCGMGGGGGGGGREVGLPLSRKL